MEAYAITDWDELEAAYFGYEMPGMPPVSYGAAVPSAVPSYLPAPSIRDREQERRRARARQKEKRLAVQSYRAREHQISRRRFREAVMIVCAILIVAGMFGFILYRQSQITALNFQNNAASRRISTMNQETSQIQEELVANTNLDLIRLNAMEKLGMQDPSAKQIVVVAIPSVDRLITNDFSSTGTSSKASLAAAKENLAEYYQSLR